MQLIFFVFLGLAATASAWPGMNARYTRDKAQHHESVSLYKATGPRSTSALFLELSDNIGPVCTVGAHQWDAAAPCPTMPQPPPPNTTLPWQLHTWPDAFQADWKMYFVMDDSDAPPYLPEPRTPFNVTTGKTFYYRDPTTGITNMRERYDQYCIPVFGDPTSSMGSQNKYSCDFINVGITNTSYVVLHDDKPEGAPDCCIIGRPFHPPPPTFASKMPVKWRDTVGSTVVDWNAVYDKDAGIFNYGFNAKTDEPFVFYMKGMPWLASWLWQPFYNFTRTAPSWSVWSLPASCDTAVNCPGW